MRLIYVIGEPGSGKSTLVRDALADLVSDPVPRPFAHVDYRLNGETLITQLGAIEGDFPGTDRLSMGVLPIAIDYVNGSSTPVILAEGDRLATMKFFGALTRPTTLVWAHCPRSVAAERRASRGSSQSESWITGRRTKTTRLWDAFPGHKIRINTAGDHSLAVRLLRSELEID